MTLSLSNEVLNQKALPVQNADDCRNLMPDMISLMGTLNGVGLAAPQIGISRRFFIMNAPEGVIMCINPKILQKSAETESDLEGCLSHPGEIITKNRHYSVRVLYYDENSKHTVRTFSGIYSRIFQHEMDHLNGRSILSD